MRPSEASIHDRGKARFFLPHILFFIAVLIAALSLNWDNLSWQANQKQYLLMLGIAFLWVLAIGMRKGMSNE